MSIENVINCRVSSEKPLTLKDIKNFVKERDNYTCQWKGCQRGNPKFHIQVAHLPEFHGSDQADFMRVLCTSHHIIEEILRGNTWGAKQLFVGHTILHYNTIFETGKDNKPHFGFYVYAANRIKNGYKIDLDAES